MRAPYPTARPTHTILELRDNSSNVVFSGFGLLHKGYPANPLITRQRREIFPQLQRRLVCHQGLLKVWWHSVCYSAGNLLYVHSDELYVYAYLGSPYVPIFHTPFSKNASMVCRVALLIRFGCESLFRFAYSTRVIIFFPSKYASLL